jgi:hypothetical protein
MHCFVLTKFLVHSEKLQLLSIDEKAVHKNDRFKSLDADQQCSIDTLTTILRIVVKEAHDKLKSELVARLENMQEERLAEEGRSTLNNNVNLTRPPILLCWVISILPRRMLVETKFTTHIGPHSPGYSKIPRS